ncbi:MAG: hypothetical protein HKO81_05835 [Flavobacteriaceae bacterium]|nr:hypothetical protein [Flavobacteriaceae bacterium]
MKSRQIFWLLLIYLSYNLPLLSNNLNKELVAKKVYIILRTEQSSESLQTFKSQVESNLKESLVQSEFATYKVTEQLPQIKIFKTAYKKNYDYILLIDQIANININLSDNKVNVGGKYTIQSYYLKSTNPSWKNHGDATCNISIQESVKEFSKQIVNSLTIEDLSQYDFLISSSNLNTVNELHGQKIEKIAEINIPKIKLKEVLLIKTQLELQKAKTKRVLSEIELLILETDKELVIETEKNKLLQLEIQKLRKQSSL